MQWRWSTRVCAVFCCWRARASSPCGPAPPSLTTTLLSQQTFKPWSPSLTTSVPLPCLPMHATDINILLCVVGCCFIMNASVCATGCGARDNAGHGGTARGLHPSHPTRVAGLHLQAIHQEDCPSPIHRRNCEPAGQRHLSLSLSLSALIPLSNAAFLSHPITVFTLQSNLVTEH